MFGDTESPKTAPGVQLSSRTPKVADTWGAAGASLDEGDGKAPRRSQTTPKLLKAQCGKAGTREGGDRRAVSPGGHAGLLGGRWAVGSCVGSSVSLWARVNGLLLQAPSVCKMLTLSQPTAGVRWIWGRNKGLQERC